ncbi:ornithine cyclodeaminase family protein [Actinomadura graeca]|uniref:Ornithine cyclodeaminase family protein n=1 Tax=Actinomadura graeca TaxID=2750812 RepID=A0ABX8R2C3_9ACTN|nr:hypothetical protein [Actinomadura graeca]QXJ23847.1 ornithine cyclodeaminase family protein [Actinomadura graeca]
MATSTPVFISADQARDLLDWRGAVDAMADAYDRPAEPAAFPPRSIAERDGAWLRAHIGVPETGRWMGAKLFARSPGRAASFVLVLFDKESGEVACLLDGSAVTAWRTAATSALAVGLLTPGRRHDVALVGSGLEARTHLEALVALGLAGSARVFSPTPANRERFAAEAGRALGVDVRPCRTVREAADGASLVLGAARSRDEIPTFGPEEVADGVLVVSIGSTLPAQREVAVELIAASDVIVADDVEEVGAATGDMIAARAAGVDVDRRLVSLHALKAGGFTARVAEARRVLYKSAGSAIQDLTLAAWLFDRARSTGAATPQTAPFELKQPTRRAGGPA